jgi:2-keto-4-pentenoate hydratase/2-oxohepta-3-ene-1,7-dioic acid hydratase in catechol pathway
MPTMRPKVATPGLNTQSSYVARAPWWVIWHRSVRPKASTKLDFEAELAVIIGKRARHLTAANALEHVAGYSVLQRRQFA